MDANELYDPEFRKLIKSKKPTVIIPVGSLEQHGAHLPITTDSDIVTEIASRLGKKCGFIVFPTISYGISCEHDPLFNTSLSPEILRDFMQDIIQELMVYSLTSVIILNGHHGNERNLEKLHRVFNDPSIAAAAAATGAISADAADAAAQELHRLRLQTCHYWKYMKHEFDHAGFVETSIMLAISDKVKMKEAKKGLIIEDLSKLEQSAVKKRSTQPFGFSEVAPNGVWGDPTGATKKDGEKFLAEIVRNLAKECQY
jgi:creatinine amidohydrolase